MASVAICVEDIKTGYWLYNNLRGDPKNMNPEKSMEYIYSMAYMQGVYDGIAMMEDLRYDMIFKPKLMSEKDIKEIAKALNYKQLNTPIGGINVGQLELIFKKWAKEHPGDLHHSAKVCVYAAAVDAFSRKSP